MSGQSRGPGRPPTYEATRKRPTAKRVSLTFDTELIKVLDELQIQLGEPSLSALVRRLLKERLAELGVLKEDVRRLLGIPLE